MRTPVEVARARDEVARHQRALFITLVRHAWHSSRFYRELYSARGIKEGDLAAVRPEDLPVVDKKLLMAHFDDAVTDPRLSRDAVARWIDDVGDPGLDYLDEFVVCHS